MNFFAEVPPIEERALENGGDIFLRAAVRLRERLITPTPMRIARLSKDCDKRMMEAAHALDNAGLIDIEYHGQQTVKRISLTAAGERVAEDLERNAA